MKKLEIEFRVTKKIGKSEFGICTDYDSFMDLLSDAARIGEKMKWEIGGDNITFFIDDEEIGDIYIWEEEEENK